MRQQLWGLLFLSWIGFQPAMAGDSPAPTPGSAGPALHVAADTPSATAAGTTFTIPSGWTARPTGQVLVLSPPEPDLKVALIDLEAKDAATAVATAWAAFDPKFKRPLHITMPQAPRDGWEERHYFDYEVSPNEKLGVSALAWRAGNSWLVMLIDGSQGTLEKREGPIGQIVGSLRPKGYQRETFAGKTARTLDAQKIQAMKDFVANGMKLLKVPGVAFSLIDGGKVVYEGGMGVREYGKPEPVDAGTRFMAGANTQTLVTLLLAELVDEQKLRWDEPVIEAYPPFKLGDAATTQQVLIKHLVCACTGMPPQDFEWEFGLPDATPATAFAELGEQQPTSKFGEVFQYNNLMVAAAGYIGGSIAVPHEELGAAFDEAMQQRVFSPLGMARSTFDFRKAMSDDYARPHDVDIDGQPAVGEMTPNYTILPLRPAGGLWTTSHDLSQYVVLELAKGRLPAGRRLVSEENLLARRAPNIVVDADRNYGMSLVIDKRWGVTIVHHGGSNAGYHSDMIWLPDYGAGAVILANSETSWALLGPFMRKLVELMFDGKPEAEGQLEVAAQQIDQERSNTRKSLAIPADAAASGKLAAHYRSDSLGGLTVTRKDTKLAFVVGGWQSEVASRKNDDGTVSFVTISPTLQGFEFVAGERDGKRTLTTRDGQHEYVFVESR